MKTTLGQSKSGKRFTEGYKWENVKRPLHDKAIKSFPTPNSTMKVFDSEGLYLELSPSGSKHWRYKYRFDGKERRLSFGRYPEIGLAAARSLRDEAREMLEKKVDPSAKIEVVVKPTFEEIAREWISTTEEKRSVENIQRALRRLERDVFPWIGSSPVDSITGVQVLAVLERAQDRGVRETAHRTLWDIKAIFARAILKGIVTHSPADAIRRRVLKPMKTENFPAVTEPPEVGALLRAIDGYSGSLIVKSMIRLAPLVFVRPGELRQAKWAHVNFETAEWRFVTSKTKTPLIVPLSRQAQAILKDIQHLTGGSEYIFPSPRSFDRPLSDAAGVAGLRAIGYDQSQMTIHGFRAMATTNLKQELKFPAEIIDHQLGHRVKDANGEAYNRTTFLPDRKIMMQRWADWLDAQRDGAKVLPFKKGLKK